MVGLGDGAGIDCCSFVYGLCVRRGPGRRPRAGTRRQQTHPPMQTSSTRPAARDARLTNCLEYQTLNAAKIYENGV